MVGPNRRLMWHGILLFLLGLGTGLLEQHFANMRMGVSAHLEGVMNGTFLMVLGAIWTEVRLSPPAKTAAFWTALYGTYANWFFTTFGAVFGTAAANPIVAGGHHGKTLARDCGRGRIPERGCGDHCCLAVRSLGSSSEGAKVSNASESQRINTA